MGIAIVYMVAGMSSRFGGRPKQFAIVGPNGESLIEYSIKNAIGAGFNKIIFITGEKTDSLFKDRFGEEYEGTPVFYAKQEFDLEKRDRPWGTCDAVCSAIDLIDCPFVVCNGDDIYDKKDFETVVKHLKSSNEDAAVGYKLVDVVPDDGKVNRGIFMTDNIGNVQEIREVLNIEKNNLVATNTKEDDLCSMNLFALHKETLGLLSESLDKFKTQFSGDRKVECFLPSELSALIKSGKIKMKLYGARGKWFGVTNPEDEYIVRGELIKLG